MVLNDQVNWKKASLFQRSILVHEAYHAKDDLELAGQAVPHLDAEVRAWSGQGAYLAEEISQSAEPNKLRKEFLEETSTFDELTRLTLSLALANATVTPEAKGEAELLSATLQDSLVDISNTEGFYEKPAESLGSMIGLAYQASNETLLPLDGIRVD